MPKKKTSSSLLSRKITPCLLFSGRAEEAAEFYISVFKGGKITHRSPLATGFRIEGHDFVALNGPESPFTWAVSFYVACKTQKEVDSYWSKLRAGGGEEQPCGWVKDRFGLSWQIVPVELLGLIEDEDRSKADRVMQAMFKMKKLDLAKLKKAHAGGR